MKRKQLHTRSPYEAPKRQKLIGKGSDFTILHWKIAPEAVYLEPEPIGTALEGVGGEASRAKHPNGGAEKSSITGRLLSPSIINCP